MNVKDKVVVVTGAASGIGKALAVRFVKEGAEAVLIADLNRDALNKTLEELAAAHGSRGSNPDAAPFWAVTGDVSKEGDVQGIVRAAEEEYGRIDLFCSNAGISRKDPDIDNPGSPTNAEWELAWGVNVMAHVYAARHAMPGMIARKSGWFLNTVSAAGLLSQIGSAVYSTTKHAAIGFGEHLAIAAKENGIGVSLLCPQAVDTPMLGGAAGSQNVDGVLSPADVAEAVVQGLAAESFLILPHPQVTTYMQRKTGDYDRWIRGMTRLRRSVIDGARGTR
ncbi:MAG TPA: SDR family oxidoreductase [Hyphomonadaceae bacterium]|jgi:NAD(P)-dependent dehydrogenase (short-subunit alcohol dehydrogenase family)|nr:SDR family oxidoreductase [Hyphomonadaceae bacterium]